MKQRISLLALVALALAASSAAGARGHVSIGINPFGYGAYPPPVVYQPDPYYAAPPVVYIGGGSWGQGHGRHFRSHVDHGGRRH